jgi:hypothetical protein
MANEVRGFTTKELLDRVSNLEGFKGFPKDYWIIGVQSKSKLFNNAGDKFYLMHGETNVTVAPGTTRAGVEALTNFKKYGLEGAFVWKTNEIYYDFWSSFDWDGKTKYLHKGKMKALRQNKPAKGYRDNDKDKLVEYIGSMKSGIYGLNFHTNTYLKKGFSKVINWLVGSWSFGCAVVVDQNKYYDEFIPRVYESQVNTTYALIEED